MLKRQEKIHKHEIASLHLPSVGLVITRCMALSESSLPAFHKRIRLILFSTNAQNIHNDYMYILRFTFI